MGNNLVYRTQDPNEFGAKVEEVIRKDVGSPLALKYVVHDMHVPKAGLKTRLGEGMRLQAGAGTPLLARVDVKLPWHRPAFAMISMSRISARAHVTGVSFLFELARPVGPLVELAHASRSEPRFAGGALAERLNSVDGLARRAATLLRKDVSFGTILLQVRPSLRLGDEEEVPRLMIVTLPRLTGLLGQSASTDAGDVIRLVRDIEAALPA